MHAATLTDNNNHSRNTRVNFICKFSVSRDPVATTSDEGSLRARARGF